MKAFITVIGHDTVGVVARVAGLCTELNINIEDVTPVSYTHLRAHETDSYLVCRLLLEKKKKKGTLQPC